MGGRFDWSPERRQLLASLRATGMPIGIIGIAAASEIAETLADVELGPGSLLIATVVDPWCVVADGSRMWVVERESSYEESSPIFSGAEDAPMQWMSSQLWERGVALGDVIVVDARESRSGSSRSSVLAASERVDVTVAEIDHVLSDQRARRARLELPVVRPEPTWDVRREVFEIERLRLNGAIFALADGRVGTSGATVVSNPGSYRWVVAGGLYVGEGPATHLLTAPVAMQLPCPMSAEPELERVLDLHAGVLGERVATSTGPISTVRFSSMARPGTVVLRAVCPVAIESPPALLPPADHEPLDEGQDGDVSWMRVQGTPGGVVAAARHELHTADGCQTIDRIVVYDVSTTGDVPSRQPAIRQLREAAERGFDVLLAEHRAAWAARWDDADIVIDGDDELQRGVRFALFHLTSSAPDDGEAAVGARGLTGTGYRGHVFWDADTFVLPFLAATRPAAARAMLEYRLRRLPQARDIARASGRAGARFPWESAASGRDVTPLSARDRTGAIVPIRTGQLEEHIVAQVAWAASCYIDWTGDEEFESGSGREILIDTARYWASRVRRQNDGAHIYGVIGPDEYHEPVDDNAFTNVMARWNLRRAADVAAASDPGRAMAREISEWRTIADDLVDGYDANTGLYEQFSGFYKLEPLIISEVAPRRPIAADLLLGADRTGRAQVIKQADVLMLHHLIPDAVEPDTLEPNLRFYEPRTAHGSSLSPGVHASLFARARDFERALDALRMACALDLDDLTGTTGSGLHLATMGSVWQALAFGFAGLRPRHGVLRVDPRLPPTWPHMSMTVRFHGTRVRVHIERAALTIEADDSVTVDVGGSAHELDRSRISFRRRGPHWETTA